MNTIPGTISKLNLKCQCVCSKFWQLADGRLRCQVCRRTFTPVKKLIRIKPGLARKIVQEFLLEHSTNIILSRIKISKYKLLKILTLLRKEMTFDLPKIFLV